MKASGLYQQFLAVAERYPDRPALTFLDAQLRARHYTYASLYEAADKIARRLPLDDIGTRGPIGILLEDQASQVLHYLAVLYNGLAPAMLTPYNRKLNKEYFVSTTNAILNTLPFGAIISDLEQLTTSALQLQPNTLKVLQIGKNRESAPINNGVFLQFSSGTTGIKKGVVIGEEAARQQIDTYSRAIGLSTADKIISWLPLYHDMGLLACLNMPLAKGVHTIMIEPVDWVTDPVLFLRAASIYKATLSWNPNFAYTFLATRVAEEDLAGLDLSSLRGLINCSEPVTRQSQQQFYERFRPYGLREQVFRGCYAMAETTFAVTHIDEEEAGYEDFSGPKKHDSAWPQLSVGRPLPGVEMQIMDDKGVALGSRQLGEIWVKSPFSLSEYYHNPEATSQSLTLDGWYKTGDLGYKVGDRYFVCGRKKDLLIVGGANVFPEDIENEVSAVSGVHPGRAVAFSCFDDQLQTEKAVILVEPEHQDFDRLAYTIEIRKRIAAAFQLANFEVHFVKKGYLIKSSSGKMARQANREKWLQPAKTES